MVVVVVVVAAGRFVPRPLVLPLSLAVVRDAEGAYVGRLACARLLRSLPLRAVDLIEFS